MPKTITLVYFFLCIAPMLTAQTIKTIAGNGMFGAGGDGGDALRATLNYPKSVAVDKKGNVYIVCGGDYVNYSKVGIRKVDNAGIINLVTGNGDYGYGGDGGPAINAKISYPYGIAVDSAGNIYFADMFNYVVRKIDTTGIITTVAGTGTFGYGGDGGPATSAKLGLPWGLAIDNKENLYIVDESYFVVRMVSPAGIITTIAGNGTQGMGGDGGPATQASLSFPQTIAVDNAGNVYIGIPGYGMVRKVDKDGIISTFAGHGSPNAYQPNNGNGGPATLANLSGIAGLATDTLGNVYISDGNTIRVVDKNGTINTYAGTGVLGYTGDGGPAIKAELYRPAGLAVDAGGSLYLADESNLVVRKITPCKIPAATARLYASVCTGQSYKLPSGKTVTEQGIYLDTLYTVAGCDSLITTCSVQVNTPTQINKNAAICANGQAALTAPVAATYVWSTGAVTGSIIVSTPAVYTVLVVDSFGCRVTDSFFVSAYPNPILHLAKDTAFCTQGTLDAGTGYKTYLWNTGSKQPSINVNATGKYWVAVSDTNGCQAKDTVTVTAVFDAPSDFLAKKATMCMGSYLTLKASSDYIHYLWSNGSTSSFININNGGSYWLRVTDLNNCDAYDTTFITEVDCLSNIKIPNAFSPNGDGINDTWKINLDIYPDVMVEVFNRYGQPVFQSRGYAKAWDGKYNGKELPLGTYYYVIAVSPNHKPLNGSVTILK